MTSLVVTQKLPHRATWIGGARRRVLGAWQWPADTQTAAARALLARAERYEATQPGFAADLREAARSLPRAC